MAKEQLTAVDQQPCIGLFGSCGETTFRQTIFIPAYEQAGIPFFNPQLPVGTWKAEDALTEADHLAHDVIQCWPVTAETPGLGSLAEIGFSIATTLRAPTPLPKFVLPMIDPVVGPEVVLEELREESNKARAIARANLERSLSPNILVMRSLEEMRDTSIQLFPAVATIVDLIKSHNPAFERFRRGREENVVFREALERGRRRR